MSATDRIDALKAEIADLEARCAERKLELDRLTVIPAYIKSAIECLVRVFGKNAKWESKITLILEEHLKSVPKYEGEYQYTERGYQIITHSVKYIWDDMKYLYCHINIEDGDETYTYFGDSSYGNDSKMGEGPLGVQEDCVEFKKWDDLEKAEHFEMKYLPILIAYLEGEMPLDE